MNTVYDNLCALAARPPSHSNWRGILLHQTAAGVEVRIGAWNHDGRIAVLVTPDNHATYHVDATSQHLNLLLGELGLGAIANNNDVRARQLFWLNGKSYVYVPGMTVDLNTAQVDPTLAPPHDAVVVDSRRRHALLKLIRAKVPQAQSYLRVSGVRYLDVLNMRAANEEPAAFLDAVQDDATSLIATIPIRRLRSHKFTTDPLHSNYPTLLDAYINQNRAELYRAGDVLVSAYRKE